ncbi:snaclec coagulation factor IX/factor X-binding protein subunit A-like [Pholidichthys leucotaenia]
MAGGAGSSPVTLEGGSKTEQNTGSGLLAAAEPGKSTILESMYMWMCFLDGMMLKEEKMTWEEALWHCEQTQSTLTSLSSEADNTLALKQIQKSYTLELVWIGLRYLGDRWLWVDGSPLQYEAWSTGRNQDIQCPTLNRCGALTKEGVWVNLDCGTRQSFICN